MTENTTVSHRRRVCFCSVPSLLAQTATGRFVGGFGGEHNRLHHCRQVHLPLCEYVPRRVQLQLPYEDPKYQVGGKHGERPENSIDALRRDVSELNVL